jgi:thymidylate synthase
MGRCSTERNRLTRRGIWPTSGLEILLELRNPRARPSRTETRGKVFSCLGELLWYLSRDNRLEFIAYCIKGYEKVSQDGETVHGGYS